MNDPAHMQPHELEAELGVDGSRWPTDGRDWRWMRVVVALQRRVERLEAVNKRQLEYYRNTPEAKR